MSRQQISTGTDWEDSVGYSRAVRAGNQIHVSGTTATDTDGELLGDGEPYTQAAQALSNIEESLSRAAASLEDVVRTRIYVTDIDDWEEIGRAHCEMFGELRPATSMVQVDRLIDPAMCVEIEAVAIVEESTKSNEQ